MILFNHRVASEETSFPFRSLGIPADRPSKDQMPNEHKEFVVCAHRPHVRKERFIFSTEQMFAPKSCKWTTNLLPLNWISAAH